MKNINFSRIGRIMVCCLLAAIMLAPVETEGARKKRRKATTTATTKKKTASRSHSTRRTSRRTVTQETQEAAITASKLNSAAEKRANNQKKQSGLTKITVEKPDLEQIRVASLNPSDRHYFPKMMKKYLDKDTTMTPDEFRYLYLGYMFQEDYDPYRDSPYNVRFDTIGDTSKMSKAEMKEISDRVEKALQDNPFDLRQMSTLVHLLKAQKKFMKAKIWEYRLENLLGAIKSTGTGEDAENAWYVIYPMHEYDMVQLLGYSAVDVDYVDPGVDHLIVEPDGTINHRKPAEGFFFNVLVPQQQYELKHPDEVESEDEPSEDVYASGE